MSYRPEQLALLGIPIPPEDAFRVDLSEREFGIFLLYAVTQLLQQSGGESYSATSSTIPVGSTSSILAAATTVGRRVAIYNNSANQVLWFRIGGTPVADTGTIDAPNGNGVGISLLPGGDWESPVDFVSQVNGIALATCNTEVVVSTPQ